MSYQATRHVWDTTKRTNGELIVMLAVADYADKTGKCWATADKIASRARMNKTYARRLLKNLSTGKDAELVMSKSGKKTVYQIAGMSEKDTNSHTEDAEIVSPDDTNSHSEKHNLYTETIQISQEAIEIVPPDDTNSTPTKAETEPSTKPNKQEPTRTDREQTMNETPKPLTGPTPEEQKRILHKITQLVLAKQDAKTDAERDGLQAQFDQYRAELAAAEQREAAAAGLD